MKGNTTTGISGRPVLLYTVLQSGIPGYDIELLMLSSFGIVALLGYKYRNRRTE